MHGYCRKEERRDKLARRHTYHELKLTVLGPRKRLFNIPTRGVQFWRLLRRKGPGPGTALHMYFPEERSFLCNYMNYM